MPYFDSFLAKALSRTSRKALRWMLTAVSPVPFLRAAALILTVPTFSPRPSSRSIVLKGSIRRPGVPDPRGSRAKECALGLQGGLLPGDGDMPEEILKLSVGIELGREQRSQ